MYNTEYKSLKLILTIYKDVVVGPGSKELIYLTMNVLEGTVILLSPAWPSYLPQVSCRWFRYREKILFR